MTETYKLTADAVLFDKDGTLIDFDAFWVSLSRTAIAQLLARLQQDASLLEEILEAFGIHNGVTDPNGVVCKGTYGQMAQVAQDVLLRHGIHIPTEQVEPLMLEAYNQNFSKGCVKPTCPELAEVLTALKQRGKKLAVATTDNRELTLFCLERLGVAHLFDKIYTDDGDLPPKPHPDIAQAFCAWGSLSRERVVMVGDTVTDLSFARNAGLPMIGLAKTPEHDPIFRGQANAIIRSLAELLAILE